MGMRQFNERVVLQAIRLNAQLPKAELARMTGLTAQTIGMITSHLEEDRLLIRHDPVRGRIGQPSIPMALNPDGAFALGVKIGRRSADILLVDFTSTVRQRYCLPYEYPNASSLLPNIGKHFRTIEKQLGPLSERLVGVGLAAPFNLGGWHRLLGLPAAISEEWNRIDLASELQSFTKLPVSFAKDTSAACMAELVKGRGRDLKSFLYLFVDTFIGGGLVLNSQLHLGVHGNSAAVASLPLHLARSNGKIPEQLITHASLWELEQLFTKHQLDRTAAYDERALSEPFLAHTLMWIDSAATALAQCITSGIAFLDVDAVVIDGSFCRAMLDKLLERTRAALSAYDWEGLWATNLVAGSIGSDARALGGALLPLQANFALDSELFLKSA